MEGIHGRVDEVIAEEKMLHDRNVKGEKRIRKKVKKEKAHGIVTKSHVQAAKKVEVKEDFIAARDRLKRQILEQKVLIVLDGKSK